MGWAEDAANQAVKGYGALQKPEELVRLLQLADRLMPPGSAVLEIGCDVGGTLWVWSQLPAKPPVFGLTLPENLATKARTPEWHGASMVFGDSHDPEALLAVNRALGNHDVGLLFIDADHTLAAVESDYWTFRSLVVPGGLIALHDIAQHADGYSEVDVFWQGLQGCLLEIVTPPREIKGIGVVLV